jgi:hypothetical protein
MFNDFIPHILTHFIQCQILKYSLALVRGICFSHPSHTIN